MGENVKGAGSKDPCGVHTVQCNEKRHCILHVFVVGEDVVKYKRTG